MALPILGVLGGLIDKVIPDADTRLELKARAMEMEQAGQFRDLELAMQAIVAEAQSADPWTSRARPSFLYVVYVYILSAIPMGFLFALYPDQADSVVRGVQGWLASIPAGMWAAFTAGYLGYVNKRSQDKAVALGQAPSEGLLSKILG